MGVSSLNPGLRTFPDSTLSYHNNFIIIIIIILIYNTVQKFKVGKKNVWFLKKVSYAQKGCICLIKNKRKPVILWTIVRFVF